MTDGKFITFEGIDGSGKSTQIRLLHEHLQKMGRPSLITREPGGSSVGEKIRNLLLEDAGEKLVPNAKVMLLMADRMQHLSEKILPAVRAGKLVLCDRFFDSTLAYQEGGEGLNLTWLKSFFADHGTLPHLTFFFRIPPEISMDRLRKKLGPEKLNHFDRRGADFFRKVDAKYRELIEQDTNRRFRMIDAEAPSEQIHQSILQTLSEESF